MTFGVYTVNDLLPVRTRLFEADGASQLAASVANG
jgi:hypothetical protein